MKPKLFQLYIVTLICTLFSCKSHETAEAYLEELHISQKLNGDLLVVKKDSIILNKSFGYADGSKTKSLTPYYRFNLGSIYKEFPGVAIMQLQEQGRLQLDNTIAKHLGGLPQWATKITIQHLLQYSGGLPRVDWDKYFSKNILLTETAVWEDLWQMEKLNFEPGLDYLYTNYSPMLLMKIVENISGKSFQDYAMENLFKPAEMTSIILKQNFPYQDKTLMAVPFDQNFDEDTYKMKADNLLFTASTMDLYQWLKHLHNGKIISKKSIKRLSVSFQNDDDYQSHLGVCEWDDGKVKEHSHHGSSGNYEGIVRYFPEEDLYIVVLTNQKHGNVREISDKLRTIINKNR